jgi:hypothetical protein
MSFSSSSSMSIESKLCTFFNSEYTYDTELISNTTFVSVFHTHSLKPYISVFRENLIYSVHYE